MSIKSPPLQETGFEGASKGSQKPKSKGYEQNPEPIRILHISDLHIETENDIDLILQPLIDDIKGESEGIGIKQIDYIVISGDLINSAGSVKFQNALILVQKLLDKFHLRPDRCIIVPGNHDLHWDKPGIFDKVPYREGVTENLDPESYIIQEKEETKEKVVWIKNENNYGKRFEEEHAQ